MPRKPKSNRPPVDLGNAPPEGAQEGSAAYLKWLAPRDNGESYKQPIGDFNHDDFIARQFAVDGKMTSTNTHEDAVKARRVKKNAKQAAHKVAKREEREQLKMLAASHAAVEKALQIQGNEHKVRKVKKQAAKKRTVGPAAELSEPRVAKEDLVEEDDEQDAPFEWEDVVMDKGVPEVNNDGDDLEQQLYAALNDNDEKSTAVVKAESNGGFAPDESRQLGEGAGRKRRNTYDRFMLKYYG